MTLKQFRLVKIVIALIVAAIIGTTIISNDFWLTAAILSAAIIIVYVLRSRVKEVMADERDYEIAGRAARYTMTAMVIGGYILALALMSQRQTNPLYEAIGAAISYAICLYLLGYNLIFTYLSKSMSRGRKVWFYIMTVVLIIFFVVSGLRLFSGDEDTWICQGGQWVRHGNPSASQPTAECLK